MRKFLSFFAILTALVFPSCEETLLPSEDSGLKTISIVDKEVLLCHSSISTFDFLVSPENAEIDSAASWFGASLQVIESIHLKAGVQTPQHYQLVGIQKNMETPGQYTAKVKDLGLNVHYDDKVVLQIKTQDSLSNITIVESEPFNIRFTGTSLKDVRLLKENNETAIYEDIYFNLKDNQYMVATPFISNPNLALSFETNGGKVLVGDVEQVSGKTVNDFSSPVTYKVIDANGGVAEYVVSVTYSGLPVLFINTPNSATIPDKHSDWLAKTEMTLYNPDWTVNYEGTTGIRGRGNSTWGYPKKPYALKLDSGAEILGMPKHKRWVLLANWMDRTIMRNRVAFEIAMRTDLAWTPHGEFVELVLNGKHVGNYYLCEHIKIDENRVNIDELEDDKTDSGYLMEIDTNYDEVNKFKSYFFNLPYMFKDPDEVNNNQFLFLRNYVNNMEESLQDYERFAAREYEQYLDVTSFIDWWLVQELTGNEEAQHPKSTYMHKDKGGKLTMGPVWDFDWGTFMPHTKFRNNKYVYYGYLFQDPVFKAKAKEQWNKNKAKLQAIPEFITSEAARIKGSESMNQAMWPISSTVNQDVHLSFEDAIEKMKSAYINKFNWMDKEINKW